MSCTISVVTEKEDIPLNPIDGKPTYVYWKILGLAQSARLALVAASVDFVDVQIDADKSKDGWIAAKGTPEMEKTLTFPNLPYFLHPDLGGRGIVQVSKRNSALRVGLVNLALSDCQNSNYDLFCNAQRVTPFSALLEKSTTSSERLQP